MRPARRWVLIGSRIESGRKLLHWPCNMEALGNPVILPVFKTGGRPFRATVCSTHTRFRQLPASISRILCDAQIDGARPVDSINSRPPQKLSDFPGLYRTGE